MCSDKVDIDQGTYSASLAIGPVRDFGGNDIYRSFARKGWFPSHRCRSFRSGAISPGAHCGLQPLYEVALGEFDIKYSTILFGKFVHIVHQCEICEGLLTCNGLEPFRTFSGPKCGPFPFESCHEYSSQYRRLIPRFLAKKEATVNQTGEEKG
ncbi:hypothetical protein EYC80_011114 [Monilinia laxa]|uniref:Uncharacterized protein n=1 Tax=Monilinia laxa TaxID=61186 RepID=A0A5N6JP05_MONLA|nr:hypothetical protein EYC80_011114 [Monilinia laxa]